ncbi:MAG: hypothetical protein ACI4L2_05610 [Wujia sp.]
MRQIKIFAVIIMCMAMFIGCSASERDDNVTAENGNIDSEMVSFSNSGENYTVNIDTYVTFRETTTDTTSNVNNVDGLELNYNDTYFTVQRFPSNSNIYYSDLDSFCSYVSGDGESSSMLVGEGEVTIQNESVLEYKVQTVEAKSGSKLFTGYLYFFVTDNGYYFAQLSGSEPEIVAHYKNFIDDMEFN